MTVDYGVLVLVVLVLAMSAAWGQDAQQPADAPTDNSPQQPMTLNQDTQSPPASENPPISGLDLPNLEPHAAPLSYLQAGGHLNQSVDSNIQNTLGGSTVSTISRATGSLLLQRQWHRYDLSLNYLGGVGYYDARGLGLRQIQELGVNQKINWKRGELTMRDAFSYQPEGTFGGTYGSMGAPGAGLGGSNAFFGGAGLGSLGQVPRIMNLSVVDLVEALTPKSVITVAGGFGFVHFLENEPETGTSFIGSQQVSAQTGYSRVLGPHDQGALVYGYQGFDFSTGVNFHSHIIQLMWGHRISGRMDFIIGVGPQFTQINDLPTVVAELTPTDTFPPCVISSSFQFVCPTNDLRIGAAGRAILRYKFPKVNLDLSYLHYLTNGSGLFAGSETDVARLTANRQLGRIWTASTDIGYTRNSRVLPVTCPSTQNPSSCPGVSARVFQYGFAGLTLHRMFGRTLHGFASYQFNELAFDSSYCQTTNSGACSRISQRHIATIGLDWTPRPIRLD